MPASLAAAIEAFPSPPDSLTFLTNEWGPPVRQEELQHLVPQANGRSRAAGYVGTAPPAQGGLPHHGRERLQRARDHVGERPFIAQGS